MHFFHSCFLQISSTVFFCGRSAVEGGYIVCFAGVCRSVGWACCLPPSVSGRRLRTAPLGPVWTTLQPPSPDPVVTAARCPDHKRRSKWKPRRRSYCSGTVEARWSQTASEHTWHCCAACQRYAETTHDSYPTTLIPL